MKTFVIRMVPIDRFRLKARAGKAAFDYLVGGGRQLEALFGNFSFAVWLMLKVLRHLHSMGLLTDLVVRTALTPSEWVKILARP